MNKKKYILKVITKVRGIRAPAEEIIKELEEDNLTDTYIDYLYNECVNAVKEAVKDEENEQKDILLHHIQSIKELEKKQQIADESDIACIEQLINQI